MFTSDFQSIQALFLSQCGVSAATQNGMERNWAPHSIFFSNSHFSGRKSLAITFFLLQNTEVKPAQDWGRGSLYMHVDVESEFTAAKNQHSKTAYGVRAYRSRCDLMPGTQL